MTRESENQNPLSQSANIRSPEERYGGEGHAGDDPFASPKRRNDGDGPADSPVEVPNAELEELIELPDLAEEKATRHTG